MARFINLNIGVIMQTLFFVMNNWNDDGSYWIVVENSDGNPYPSLIADETAEDYIGIEPIF